MMAVSHSQNLSPSRATSRNSARLGALLAKSGGEVREGFCSVRSVVGGVSCWREYRHRNLVQRRWLTAMSASLSKTTANLSVMKTGLRKCPKNSFQNRGFNFILPPALMSEAAIGTRPAPLSRRLTCCARSCAPSTARQCSTSSWMTARPHGGRSYSATADRLPQHAHSSPACNRFNGSRRSP